MMQGNLELMLGQGQGQGQGLHELGNFLCQVPALEAVVYNNEMGGGI